MVKRRSKSLHRRRSKIQKSRRKSRTSRSKNGKFHFKPLTNKSGTQIRNEVSRLYRYLERKNKKYDFTGVEKIGSISDLKKAYNHYKKLKV